MCYPVSVIPTKVLVPIAFNAASHAALDAAAELAQHFGSELYLLHVIFDPAVTLPQSASESAIITKASEVASLHFQVSQARLQAKGVKATTSIESGSDVAGTILGAIDREEAGLVVVNTDGFGYLAEKLVRLAPCPILLLRSAKLPLGRMTEWW